jgi:hypothetical protein
MREKSMTAPYIFSRSLSPVSAGQALVEEKVRHLDGLFERLGLNAFSSHLSLLGRSP